MGLTGKRTTGEPGFKIGSSEEQQPICYWPLTWHPREAFQPGDCNSSPCTSQSAHLLNAHAAKRKRKNTPTLLPKLRLHWHKSPWEILQALKTLSWSSTIYFPSSPIYFPSEYFLTCLLQAPTQNDNKGAQRGECRAGASLFQPGKSEEWTL